MPKQAIQDQKNRCPNCRVQLNSGGFLFSDARYCNFYGMYFCTNCHNNDSYIVPSYIIKKFDFTL